MDSVLRGCYQGKLEHHVVNLYETLPPPRCLTNVVRVPPQPVGSSIASEGQSSSHTVTTPPTASRSSTGLATDGVVDNKVGIVVGDRWVAEKRKVVQAMSGPALGGGSGLIGRRMMQLLE